MSVQDIIQNQTDGNKLASVEKVLHANLMRNGGMEMTVSHSGSHSQTSISHKIFSLREITLFEAISVICYYST